MILPDRDPGVEKKSANRHGAEVIFIGNQCNFSDCLIAATRRELGEVACVVFGSLDDLRDAVEFTAASTGVLIVDEPSLRGLSAADREFLLGVEGLSLGIAFATSAFGVACYRDTQLRARSPSIFPLNVRLDVWLSIVKLIAHGGSYVCPQVVSPSEPDMPGTTEPDHGLTPRQLDVLHLVADGQSNKRIAASLGLSIHTVKLHLHNATLRLGARNRTEAAIRYRAMRG